MDPSRQDYHLAGLAALAALASRRGKGKKQLILPGAGGQTQQVRRVKVGRNEPCPCGSGKKFKKCHGANRSVHQRPEALRPKEKPVISGADVSEVSTTAPAPKQATARAMLNAKIPERIVWAYLETGLFITDQNRPHQSEEDLKTWDAALVAYDNATPEERQILEVPAALGDS